MLGVLTTPPHTHTQNDKTKAGSIEHILNIRVSNKEVKGEKENCVTLTKKAIKN